MAYIQTDLANDALDQINSPLAVINYSQLCNLMLLKTAVEKIVRDIISRPIAKV
jgi:hypothetical protein